MSSRVNKKVSLVMTVICYLLAVAMPNVGFVISLTGATVNPFIGFIFPILFYLKLDPAPIMSFGKLFAIFIMITISIISVLGLVMLFK